MLNLPQVMIFSNDAFMLYSCSLFVIMSSLHCGVLFCEDLTSSKHPHNPIHIHTSLVNSGQGYVLNGNMFLCS